MSLMQRCKMTIELAKRKKVELFWILIEDIYQIITCNKTPQNSHKIKYIPLWRDLNLRRINHHILILQKPPLKKREQILMFHMDWLIHQ